MVKGGIVACILLLATMGTQAAHVTEYLNALQAAVTNRQVTVTNDTVRQRQALRSARAALSRNTSTIAAEVRALASASAVLNSRFPTNFVDLEIDAYNAYVREAHLELDLLTSALGTNAFPRGSTNQYVQAQRALAQAENEQLSDKRRLSYLALAFDKLRIVNSRVYAKYTAPAALMKLGLNITLTEDAPSDSETTIYYFHIREDGFQDYTSHNPEELGTWAYSRTGDKTGALRCSPNHPPDYHTIHDMLLNFTTPRGGTFSGQSLEGPITGTFVITDWN